MGPLSQSKCRCGPQAKTIGKKKALGPKTKRHFLQTKSVLAAADRATDRVEAGAHVVAQGGQRADQNNGDQSCDQTIFDSGCAGLIVADFREKLFHFRFPFYMRPGG